MKYSSILKFLFFLIFLSISFPSLYSIFAQTGINRSFFPDGNIASEISYINDKLDGPCYWFYENGNLKKEETYSEGVLNGWIREYYPTGVIKLEMKISNGIKDGQEKHYYENGGLQLLKYYSLGKLIREETVTFDPNYVPPKSKYFTEISNVQNNRKRKEEYICPVDICPEPVGGIDGIVENIIYPEDAKKYGLEGTVSLTAMVDAKGNVTGTDVFRGIGLGCDEAAEAAVKQTKFIPAQDGGEVVPSEVIINIPFKLDNLNIEVSSKTTKQKKVDRANKKERKVADLILSIADVNCDAEECPYPDGGLNGIIENLFYKNTGRSDKPEGTIIISVKVDKSGNVLYTKILKGINKKINDQLEAAVINTKFIPGKTKGTSVQSTVSLVININ